MGFYTKLVSFLSVKNNSSHSHHSILLMLLLPVYMYPAATHTTIFCYPVYTPSYSHFAPLRGSCNKLSYKIQKLQNLILYYYRRAGVRVCLNCQGPLINN